MRGPDAWAVAVRTPSGDIAVRSEALPAGTRVWTRVPVVRGLVALVEAMRLGYKALRWSAVTGLGQPDRRATPWERVVQAVILIAVLGAVITVPTAAAAGITGARGGLLFHTVETALSLAVLVGYIASVGRLGEVRRLFENHGAEHKVVSTYEAGLPLTPDLAQAFPTRHVRCGTSFLLVIAAVSAVFAVVIGHLALPALLASRVLIVPLVAGVSAELQLRAADNLHRRWVRALVRPGLALQRLTTREPTPAQLEVAIVALREALEPGIVTIGVGEIRRPEGPPEWLSPTSTSASTSLAGQMPRSTSSSPSAV